MALLPRLVALRRGARHLRAQLGRHAARLLVVERVTRIEARVVRVGVERVLVGAQPLEQAAGLRSRRRARAPSGRASRAARRGRSRRRGASSPAGPSESSAPARRRSEISASRVLSGVEDVVGHPVLAVVPRRPRPRRESRRAARRRRSRSARTARAPRRRPRRSGSVKPFTTAGWSPKPGAERTKPSTFTQRSTRSSSPNSSTIRRSASSPVRAPPRSPPRRSRSAPTTPAWPIGPTPERYASPPCTRTGTSFGRNGSGGNSGISRPSSRSRSSAVTARASRAGARQFAQAVRDVVQSLGAEPARPLTEEERWRRTNGRLRGQPVKEVEREGASHRRAPRRRARSVQRRGRAEALAARRPSCRSDSSSTSPPFDSSTRPRWASWSRRDPVWATDALCSRRPVSRRGAHCRSPGSTVTSPSIRRSRTRSRPADRS